MSEHTKEPWRIRELRGDCFITAAIEPGMAYGPEIMGDDYTGHGGAERKRADARRIVACVNACEGFSIEELEGANLCKDSIDALKAHDTALLRKAAAVCRSIPTYVGIPCAEELERMAEAIEKGE